MVIAAIITIITLPNFKDYQLILQSLNLKQLKRLIIQETIHMREEKFHFKARQPMMLTINHMNSKLPRILNIGIYANAVL